MVLISLVSCATPTAVVAPPDPRLTAPCEKPALPEHITVRRLGITLIEAATAFSECNARIKLLRE